MPHIAVKVNMLMYTDVDPVSVTSEFMCDLCRVSVQ